MQISAKEAHYPHIAQTPDVESQHGDPDHPINLIKFSLYHWRSNQNLLMICSVMAEFPTGQSDRHQNLITCSFYHPGPFHKISSQYVFNFLNNVANRQTDKKTDKQTNKSVMRKYNFRGGDNEYRSLYTMHFPVEHFTICVIPKCILILN